MGVSLSWLSEVPTKNGTVQGVLIEGCNTHEDIATAAWSRSEPKGRPPEGIETAPPTPCKGFYTLI